MKKIIVNAMSAQLGGGQTHLLNIFKSGWEDCEVIFLTSSSNSLVFENAFGSSKVLNVGKVGNNFFTRAVWENLFLSRFAIKNNADIVFLAGGLAPFLMNKEIKWVAISHNLLPFSWGSIFSANGVGLKLKLFIIRYAQLWAFQNVKGVVFTSEHAKKVITNFFKKKVNDIVIPSGIHSMFFEKKESLSFEEPYILYVSTFFQYKHQVEVIRAFKIFQDNIQNEIKLYFVGNNSGAYGEECKRLVTEYGLNEKVVFKGNVPYSELPSLMQNSLLNLFASECENCPNILLEYLASGNPILCSNYEPMPEFGKKFVTYFDPTKVEDLASKLESKVGKAPKFTEAELNEVKNLYSWEHASSALKSFFKSL